MSLLFSVTSVICAFYKLPVSFTVVCWGCCCCEIRLHIVLHVLVTYIKDVICSQMSDRYLAFKVNIKWPG